MLLSNAINDRIQIHSYQFNHEWSLQISIALDIVLDSLKIMRKEETCECIYRHRYKQTTELLNKLKAALIPCKHHEWLQNRNIPINEAYSIDHSKLSKQNLYDLQIYPDDYILDLYGEKYIDGPAFVDIRNGNILGICVRNITKDLDYAAAEKYTVSNYGWYLYGYDLYEPNDEVYIVEGVFDAIAMRQHGYNAIGVASAYPSAFQLSCLIHKFNNLRLCLDNDFWGRVGSYIISKVIEIPAFFTELKDPGCYTSLKEMTLTNIDISKLYELIVPEIDEYNKLVESGHKFVRPLPYN